MLKKLLKVGAVFLLLLGCYFGYVRAFDLVLRQFRSERLDASRLFEVRSTKSKEEAQKLALLAFGPDHWTVTNKLPLAYYNSQRGFWMYCQDYEEIQEENGVRYDGKRLRMKPFAMISRSGDGKNIWRLIAEEAILDLNQPIGISNKNSDGIKVEHAVIERDVRIRDDRGTPDDPSDDLNIGPMTYLEYDDAKRQITSTSHVHMQDPDQTTIGDGLEIQLRNPDPSLAAQGASSSGFGGAEYAILMSNVHVTMRDVGDSGIFSGGTGAASPARQAAPKKADLTVQASAKGPDAKDAKTAAGGEPVPLYVQSAGLMRIDFPPDTVPVAVGPPAPPRPTLVRFEREVLALHGRLDDQPNQLDCDTLRLTLIPAEPPPPPKSRAGSGGQDVEKDRPSAPPAGPGSSTSVADAAATSTPPDAPPKQGLFGNLTLQKAHATGHVVWLQLRKQAAKVRCVEMIHERGMPYRPDSTFFRGDKTRKVWLEKIDYEPDEEPEPKVADAGQSASSGPPANRPRKVKSVTHVLTISAKLFDRGYGLDVVDVRAFGPGRLESRPGIDQPVERIADWQDELTIVNMVGPDGRLQQKRVTLTGTRPFFVDLLKKTSLDSAQEIRVFLKPKSSPASPAPASTAGTVATPATHVVARPSAPAPTGEAPTTAKGSDADADLGLGGSLQVERILAYRDVHFKAPNRYMEARSWLDAPFIEYDPPPAEEATAEPASEGAPAAASPAPPASAEATAKADGGKPPAAEAPGSAPPVPEPEPEPAMTAVADRIVAKVAIPRGQSLDPGKPRPRKKAAPRPADPRTDLAAAGEPAPTSSAAEEPKQGEAEILEAWLRGNVAVHQDKPPDPDKKDQAKPRGDDIRGEAVYLDNSRGKGNIIAKVWHIEPNAATRLPGPIPWAKVSTDDMIIFGQTLLMDQGRDKVWVVGPGVLNQWTERSLMTDKAAESSPPAGGNGGSAEAMAANPPADAPKPTSPARPKTRAGVPVSDKDLLTITWTKQMEFTGRTLDTAGHPAARADFLGKVDAQMTDAGLHCDQKMIVYTDREVPLGDLGPSVGGRKKGAAPETPDLPEGDENAGREAPEKSRVEIAMMYCYGNPSAISRKVDPDLPMVVEQEKIEAWDYPDPSHRDGRTPKAGRLDYNRRTGEFYVPGPGRVFLYDRPDDRPSGGSGGATPDQPGAAGDRSTQGPRPASRSTTPRTVRPTSARYPNGEKPDSAKPGRDGDGAPPGTPPVSRKIQPLVLMQVKFRDGMQGRVGAGQASDTRQERWSEFFGNIEFLRSQVASEKVILNPDDRLSQDGFYLTSQMLRIIQVPPPPGSPARTPARSFAKAWEQVHVNKGETFAIESDVATFDSDSELLWAYGEGGHGVSFAQQAGPGQPPSASSARAVRYNVKTHAWSEVEGSHLHLIDQRTGARPTPVSIPDPTAPPKPKPKQPFKVPNTNLERRGFTGY